MRNINIDSVVYYHDEIWTVSRILNMSSVSVTNKNGDQKEAKIKDLHLLSNIKSEVDDLMDIDNKAWSEAKSRLDAIRSIVFKKCTRSRISELAKKHDVSEATLYRWKEKYESSGGKLTSLVIAKRQGGKGKSRLSEAQESILIRVINEIHFTPQKRSYSKTYEELQLRCRDKNVECPSLNTLIKRIAHFSESEVMEHREGKKARKEKYMPKTGHFPYANYPLETVQIDHTPVDLIVIDSEYGEPLGRPWLTLAIDVFSRMVVGYNIGFEDPSILTTGLCIANSILSKDKILEKYNITTEWPCWGVMNSIHTDNGKDFRSEAVSRGCEEYGINLLFRPVKEPHFGGHIERLMGTFSSEFHSLKGTTFNDISKRRNYNSEKQAVFTLELLEEYVVTFITEVYHQKRHSGIGTSPIRKYKEGLWGSSNSSGIGIPNMIEDSEKLRLDFLPFFERSIQNYGVSIDGIYYYSEVLRPYIHKTRFSEANGIKRTKVKFLFRRDPRDISKLYFWDNETKQYFKIPYANMSHPAISLWELRAVKKRLKLDDDNIDEDLIFSALKKLRKLEDTASKSKRRLKLKKHQRPATNKPMMESSPAIIDGFENVDFSNIKSYDEDGIK